MSDPEGNSPVHDGESAEPRERLCVRLLLERFPQMHFVSEQLLTHHETFRELCEEYEACTEAIGRLTHSETDAALLREYSALRLRLEAELLRYISEHWSSDASR